MVLTHRENERLNALRHLHHNPETGLITDISHHFRRADLKHNYVHIALWLCRSFGHAAVKQHFGDVGSGRACEQVGDEQISGFPFPFQPGSHLPLPCKTAISIPLLLERIAFPGSDHR